MNDIDIEKIKGTRIMISKRISFFNIKGVRVLRVFLSILLYIQAWNSFKTHFCSCL